jgi:hypothetical protein
VAEMAPANGFGEEGRVAMPIAAVPEYLLKAGGERIFQDASPALRFGLLLPVWT